MTSKGMVNRREFVAAAGVAGGLAWLGGCGGIPGGTPDAYEVAVLGDTHFDAEPESVYHSHYDESNKYAQIQHEEFRRNGEMWRKRCRDLLVASARIAHEQKTDFVLQLGDIIQGDCDDVPTHKKMLDDCIRMLRAPYPSGIPFLTVVGNHDFRGKGAKEAYYQFAEPFMTAEVGRLGGEGLKCADLQPAVAVKYPAFSFRKGPDLWVFCHFETQNLQPIIDLIAADPGARHVFLVTHGPFSADDSRFFRWRLGGGNRCDALRPRLYELLSRRHAVVLSGHSHTTTYWRHENRFGSFCEFTANSVWAKPELATGEPIHGDPKDYGVLTMSQLEGEKLADYRHALDFFRPGLKGYFFSKAAGHYRLQVEAGKVEMAFYPGATRTPARTFRLA